ncbi:MAG: aromatic amino acid lyase [Flavobacteriales bacterium]|nr:aromatic amino acid lyase [Flavobacteriales bacterium]
MLPSPLSGVYNAGPAKVEPTVNFARFFQPAPVPVHLHPSTVRDLSLDTIVQLAMQGGTLRPHAADLDAVERSFRFLQEFARDKVIYGINTGFGPLVQYHIPEADSKQLQYNLVRSHASGHGRTAAGCRGARRDAFAGDHLPARLFGREPQVIERLLLFLEHGYTLPFRSTVVLVQAAIWCNRPIWGWR